MAHPNPTTLTDLATTTHGEVIPLGDPRYNSARTQILTGFNRHPAVIVQPHDNNDVAAAIAFARNTGRTAAVRSGGHSLAGFGAADDAVVVDLRLMKGIDIDPERRTAGAQTGLTAKEYTVATGEHGLVTGFGDTGTVGIGGVTLGGGIGFLARKFGMTIDDVLAAEVVTADGEVLQVDQNQHPDLFWALRGGGGNFGVVTRICYRLHELPMVYGGMLALPAEASTLLRWVEAAESASEDLSAILNLVPAEMLGPMLPEGQHGPVLVALLCFSGPVSDGAAAVEPFRIGEPLAEMLAEMPMSGIFFDQDEEPPLVQMQTIFRDSISLADIEMVLAQTAHAPGVASMLQLRVLGGAMSRVPADATAFAHRDGKLMVTVGDFYATGAQTRESTAWVQEVIGRFGGTDHPAYVSFLSDTSATAIRQAYPPQTYTRLQQVKRTYDPTNLFRHNHNIEPA